jgi:tetratricopeptide (TPR) repeat protein
MIAILNALFVMGALSPAVAIQPASETLESAYWATVEDFSKGRKEAALGALASFKQADLNRFAKSWEVLSSAARKCEGCDARLRFDRLRFRAAILLHAEADRQERNRRLGTETSTCDAGSHGPMGERLLGLTLAQPKGKEFVARFSLAMSLHFRATTCFGNALGWAATGLNSQPKNPFLTMIRGLIHEILGTIGNAPHLHILSLDDKGRAALPLDEPADGSVQLERAASDYESALTTEPRMAEARVRLGRVEWRRKRFDSARRVLTQAISESSGPLLYLAHLFLGQVFEDQGGLDEAIRNYRAATEIEPTAQSGGVALAAALALKGHTDPAHEAIENVVRFGGVRKRADPFWNYLVGIPLLADAYFEALRLESID